nr:hypothetical protein [Tanacetum cinerariifolium]
IVLSIEDKLNYLEQPISPALVVPAGQHVAPEILEEGQLVSSYVLKMKGYIDNLERLGHPVTLNLGVSLILIGLRTKFNGFVQNYNMNSLGKTINELHAMQKLYEKNLPKNNAPALHAIRSGKVQKVNKHKKSQTQMAARGQNHGKGKNKQAYAPKPKIPLPSKREDPAKDSICHECGETGHWKRNCPQYLAELLKKKKNTTLGAGGSGIFGIELNDILNRSWIYDTGCEDDLEIDEPQSDIVPICRSTRTRRAPDRMCLYIDAEEHELGDLGEASYILGIKIYRDRSMQLIGLCQSAYIEKNLKAILHGEFQAWKYPYARKGSIMYDVRCTRPDVAFAHNVTSRFQQNPCDINESSGFLAILMLDI